MDRLLLNQSNIRDILNRKYNRKEGFPLILSRNEKNYLNEKKKLRTAIFMYKHPYAYYDSEGKLVGVMPEFVQRIAEDLNVEIEIVETHSFEETQKLITNGEIDFVVDSVCDFSWSKQYNISPTQHYLTMDYVPITREDYYLNPDSNPIIACCETMLYTTDFIELNFPKDKLLYLPTIEDTLKAVSTGRADVTYVYRDSVNSLLEAAGTYNLKAGVVSPYSELICIGVYSNGDLRLWNILNKEINHVDSKWVDNIIDKHQQLAMPFSLKGTIYHHPFTVILIISLLVFGIGFFIYRYNMNRRNLEMVQRVAYTDLRYNLPNMKWLEMKVPPYFEELKNTQSDVQTFFIVFSMMSSVVVTENRGHVIIDKQFHALAKELEESEPVIFSAAGLNSGHLVCFCKAESAEKLADWAAEIIKKYSYMDTADANAKVVLHIQAGISKYSEDLNVQQAIGRAVTACLQGASGEVKIFDDKLEEYLTSQHEIESRMEDALKNDEFKSWYQPKYDIRTRKIIGAEALVRWISPVNGFMPPGKFIPLFEQNGFVIQVDYYILEKAFQLQQSRLKEGKEVVPISVNQSRLHMKEDGYLDKMRAIVNKYNLPPGLIELEITETMFEDFDAKASRQNAENIIRSLKEMGFIISVDDFGAGYSSYSLLGNLTMDVMKIDRSVLTGADKSSRMKKILGNVIKLGHSLDMSVICEGIETHEEEQLLLELGCYYGQGYLNAKPMPVDDFISFFEKRNADVESGALT